MAKIMIVDDSIVTRKNLEYILQTAGHEVVGFAIDGMQAVRLYSELKPDLVTMDISMPKLNGVDALSQIIKSDPNANIIMISALNQKQMLFEALQRGAKHYIVKPIEAKNVLNIVNKVFAGGKSLAQNKQEKVAESNLVKQATFEVQNVNGSFVIALNSTFCKEELKTFDLAMQGLMYVKPLKIMIKCEALEKLEQEIREYLELLKRRVEENGGEFASK